MGKPTPSPSGEGNFCKSNWQPIIQKAISRLEFYRFSNLQIFLPNLESVSQFINSDDYLGKIKVELEGSEERVNNPTPTDKLLAVTQVLGKLTSVLQSDKVEFIGTKEFKPYLLKDKIKDKTLNIVNDGGGNKDYGIGQGETTNQALHLDLSTKDWFVFNENFGTSEEKYLVKFIDKVYDQLRARYEDIYLVRNERHFKLYNFDDGKPLEPDFVLFLVKKKSKKSLHYQIFIEPKGGHLLKHDAWKESFLKQLKAEHKVEQLWKDKDYIIWGMPFYNEAETKAAFETEFAELL